MRRIVFALVVAVVTTTTACVPPPPPPSSTGLSGVMPGIAYQPGGVAPCEVQVEYDITLIEDHSAQIVSKAVVWGSCPFDAWLFNARVDCEQTCGTVAIPAGYYPAATTLNFTRVPDFAHLRVHLSASYAGWSDSTSKLLPTIRCEGTQCRFQP
jgi:hypothetical protein